MTTSPRRQRAFTLIELLIVVLIIPIIIFAVFGLLELLAVTHERSSMRLNARQASKLALLSWRQDVRLAEKISLGEEQQAMTLSRTDSQGRPLVVRYETTSKGQLARVIEEGAKSGQPQKRVFCQQVKDLEFQQKGGSYGISWTIEELDGVQTWRWPQSGWAAPLTPLQEDGR